MKNKHQGITSRRKDVGVGFLYSPAIGEGEMRCFVIMPFGNPQIDPKAAKVWDNIYSQWIKPAVESVIFLNLPNEQLTCHRVDKDLKPGDIITAIVEDLATADVVIADLTGKNANVFYELGVRHAIHNNTILIAQDIEDIPFDLRGQRVIIYKYTPDEMLRLRETLQEIISSILPGPSRVDNPIRRYLLASEVSRQENRSAPPGYDVYQNLIQEMTGLRNDFRRELSKVFDLVTTSTEESTTPKSNLQFLEGVWEDARSNTLLCIRFIDGKLIAPYCFGGDSRLTGIFYDFTLLGKTIFCRFKWLFDVIFGYAVCRIISEDWLTGGWWYGEIDDSTITRIAQSDDRRLDDIGLQMEKISLRRVTATHRYPEWADDYFATLESEGP